MTKVLVPLVDGVEEMEAVILIDTFRRAGWTVTAAGFKPGPVTASRSVRLFPDEAWSKLDPHAFDLFVIPGGREGVQQLRGMSDVCRAVREFHDRDKRIGAVCAGPLVLKDAGILKDRRVTFHPSVAEEMKPIDWVDQPVVIDGNIITSQAPGTTFEFALNIIEHVENPDKAEQIAGAMILRRIVAHL